MIATSVRFTLMPIWVQVWGLPFYLLLEEVGRDIGSSLGEILEVDLKAFSSDQAHFIRVRVELPLDKPLCWGGFVTSPEGDKVCIGFKYKCLVGFVINVVRLVMRLEIALFKGTEKRDVFLIGSGWRRGIVRIMVMQTMQDVARGSEMMMSKLIKGIRFLHNGRYMSREIRQLEAEVDRSL